MLELTKKISDFITKTTLGEISEDVIRTAQNAVIDCIGVTLPGSRQEEARIIRRYAREWGAGANASIIGTKEKTSALMAALANGVAAHALDLDDINSLLIGHPSAVLVPTILASGEISGAAGARVLLSYILGFEVMVKLAGMLNPAHYEHGWHATSTFGALGAAVSAAKIMGLSKEQIQMALGLAASQAGGIQGNFGTMTKSFHVGNAARTGVESAILIKMGYTAHSEILDRALGFIDVFGETSEKERQTTSLDLGDPFELIATGVDFKRYPSCGGMLAAVDAALAIRKNPRFSLGQIESIECGQSALGARLLVHSDPQNALEAKFSLEYGVCRVLIDGRLGLEELTDKKINDPMVKKLMARTKTFVHPELENGQLEDADIAQRFPSILSVKFYDGSIMKERVDNARGRWKNPLTQGEIYDKYRQYAGPFLTRDNMEKSLEILDSLGTQPSINNLISCLTE